MTETNVFQLSQPGAFTDQLTEVLRNGACEWRSGQIPNTATGVGLAEDWRSLWILFR